MKFSRSFPCVTFVVLTDCRLQCNLLSTVLSHVDNRIRIAKLLEEEKNGTLPLICWENRSHHYIDVEV